jgi:hypothetical protein
MIEEYCVLGLNAVYSDRSPSTYRRTSLPPFSGTNFKPTKEPANRAHLTVYYTRQNSWLRHCATSRKVACSIHDEAIGFFNLPNLSSCTMALGSTRPLTEMSTRNLPGGKGRPVRKADDLTAISEPIV